LLRILLLLLCGAAFAVAQGCGGDDDDDDRDLTATPEVPSEQDQAIQLAIEAYDAAVADGIDLADGPCIAEELPGLPDWVADVAHDPREEVDNLPENQCQRFGSGEATHFVELDPDGNVIQAR
jgi:hypothetical protein